MMHDMCFNLCVGFTGQFAHLESCPICGSSCYDQLILVQSSGKKKVACKQFPTVPIGPQLQAMFCDPQSAIDMQYQGKIKDMDVVLMMSIDGAQLYQCKESDCWIAIWASKYGMPLVTSIICRFCSLHLVQPTDLDLLT
ncbi:uncharacterized protein BJ212DRAFT_1411911 [Suillus subaureus]|uniref:Uncharacterized protein n=1 Tax=Suillus subaureus TaxID=48587 RepID=A0A9P7ARU2_9AGAM|nr:uncharacterized protein BJ212DRAFT_1411911 [Suillus subaureus]KAG1794935.1 hypothetical protein BJ212DRAFT_1411911 [Suillus subaureus]